MKALKISLPIFIISLLGCTTTMPDRVVRTNPVELAGKTVLVHTFQFDPNIATNVERAFIKDFGKEIALDIVDLLQKDSKKCKALLFGASQNGDLVIKGAITQVEGGNKHQRIWLGFGYGASIVSARGEVIDLNKSSSLLRFYITKKSNWTYSNNDAAVRENLNEIAQEIVTLLQNPEKEISR